MLSSRVRAESRHRLRKRVLNRRIIACSGRRTTAVFARKTSLYLFSAKRYPKTPRQMPSPTSSRLTLAPGARLKGGFKGRWTAERVISDTTLSLLKPASYAGARAFSPHLFERLFCQAGVVRRETRHADGFGAFNFAALVFLLLARHSPQAVSARAACVGCHQKVVQTTAVRRE